MGGFIWGYIGPEGSGKSASMAAIGIEHGIMVARAAGYRCFEDYCVANKSPIYCFPGFQLHSKDVWPEKVPDEKLCRDEENEGKLALSNELDIDHWLCNFSSPEYSSILILWDEAQNWVDPMNSGAVFLRLLKRGMAQRRRRRLGLIYTCQDFDWIPGQLRFLTHLYSLCFDMRWTNWGREQHMGRGEVLRVMTYDLKGFYTGIPYTKMDQRLLMAKDVWPFYDSYGNTSIFEGEQKVEVKRKVLKINPWAGEEVPVGPDPTGPMKNIQQAEAQRMVTNQLVNALYHEGVANPSLLAKVQRLGQKEI